MAGSMDRTRIETYVSEQGGRVVRIKWAPFGRGWFGEKSERIYEVVYDDAQGRRHHDGEDHLVVGVYWTQDTVTQEIPKAPEPATPVVVEIEKATGAAASQPANDPFGEMEFLRREN